LSPSISYRDYLLNVYMQSIIEKHVQIMFVVSV